MTPTRPHTEHWYRIALADRAGVRLVVAPGEHLGEAIEVARARAGRGEEAWVVAVEPADGRDVPLGESVGKGVVVAKEPPAGLPTFRWPSGVVPSLDGARQLGAVAEGARRDRRGDVHVIEAVVAGDRLVEVFMQLVEALPAADNVEVRVTGHHDAAGKTEVWLTPRLGDVRRVIRFLDDHDVELLGNGDVEVAVYLRAQRSTLRLSEHKTIVWLAEDAAQADLFVGWLADRGLAVRDTLPLVSSVDHYHWRPAKTRTRAKLVQHLHRVRMRLVDSWED